MADKTKIATKELADLIMKEIRKHSECAHVAAVGFTRPPQIASHHPNWEPAWSCNGPKIAPPIAYEIARRFQNQFDLM
jgi:hypothetical protein